MHLSTALPDGSPHSIPIWAILEDGRVAFFTQSRVAQGAEPRGTIRASRSRSSTATTRTATRNCRGRVVEVVDGDAALEVIDRISQHYIGAPFPMRSGTVYWIDRTRRTSSSCRSSTSAVPSLDSPGLPLAHFGAVR